MIKTLRSLIAFSITEGLITADPTVGVKLSKAKDTGGFPTWPMECIEQYRVAHKLGTRRGLRWNCCTERCRGAVTWLSSVPNMWRAVFFRFTSRRAAPTLTFPSCPNCKAAMDAMPKDRHLAFLVTDHGKPFTPAGFSY
jgi:hypothetical protein